MAEIVKDRFGSALFVRLIKHEWNECTVRAYSQAADIPYSFAYDVLKNLGRKAGQRFPFSRVVEWDNSFARVAPADGGRIRPKYRYGNVGRFIREHQTGSYVVRVPGHVFAIVDGVVHDTFVPALGQFVQNAWQYAK